MFTFRHWLLKLTLICLASITIFLEGTSFEWPQKSPFLTHCPYGCAVGEGDSAFKVYQMYCAFGKCLRKLKFDKDVQLKVFQAGESVFYDWSGDVGTFYWTVPDQSAFDVDYELYEDTAERYCNVFKDDLDLFHPLETLTKGGSPFEDDDDMSYNKSYFFPDYNQCQSAIIDLRSDIDLYQKTTLKFYLDQTTRYQRYLEAHPWKQRYSELALEYPIKAEELRRTLSDKYQLISDLEEKLITLHLELQEECVNNHDWLGSYFQRGKIHFDNGHLFDALLNIKKLLEEAQSTEENLRLLQGILLSELGLYSDAIAALNELININPEIKEAYFERAVAYFEQGNFDEAIADYLTSKEESQPIDANDLNSLEFAKGFLQATLKHGANSLGEFAPSLMSSLNGLGHGLWALVTKPGEVSKALITASQNMLSFLQEHSALQVTETLIPEIGQLHQRWDSLTDFDRGTLMGTVLGKYGTDFLLFAGIGKGMRAYQELRRANAAFTLETFAKDATQFASLEKIHQAWWAKSQPLIDELKITSLGRLDKDLSKLFKNQHLSELQVRKILHHAGFKTYPRPKGIPNNCYLHITNKGGGMKYVNPKSNSRQAMSIRVMPGNPKSPNPYQRRPYVVQRRGDMAFDVKGRLVHFRDPEAHIPLERYQFEKW